jgi:hypothetical protein
MVDVSKLDIVEVEGPHGKAIFFGPKSSVRDEGMTEYYGTKMVEAKHKVRAPDGAAGYTVEWQDGSSGWVAKEYFESFYRQSGEMNFGHALMALREGRRVRRHDVSTGWWSRPDDAVRLVARTDDQGEHLEMGRPGSWADWVPSTEDILAEDWCVL